jgi:hypothetical protein
LGLEESQPEDLRRLSGKLTADLVAEIVVQNVFEIDIIEVISPRVEHLEALVLDALTAEACDIFNDEGRFAFVHGGGVSDVVLVNVFLGIADKLSDSLDA